MKKWNLVIDVARCHDCNDCFLADKDEFVGNDFPPYSAAQPWHGHRWMNIKRKERGQYPHGADRVPAHAVPCTATTRRASTADGAVYKRDDGLVIIDPVKAKGRKEIVATLPLRRHLLERREAARPEVHRLRPPDRRRLDRDPLLAGVPHRAPSSWCSPTTPRWRASGRGEGLEALQARARRPGRACTTGTCTAGRRRSSAGSVVVRRHRRVRRGRHGDGRRATARRWARPRPTTSATSWWTGSSPAGSTS